MFADLVLRFEDCVVAAMPKKVVGRVIGEYQSKVAVLIPQ
jgi:hypothetical protein